MGIQTALIGATVTSKQPLSMMEASGRRSAQWALPVKLIRVSLLTFSWAVFFRSKGSALTLVFWLRMPSSWQEIRTGEKNRFS